MEVIAFQLSHRVPFRRGKCFLGQAVCLQWRFAPSLFIFTLNCGPDGATDSSNQRVPCQLQAALRLVAGFSPE